MSNVDLILKMIAQVFEPTEQIESDILFKYAEEAQNNAQDNIEWAIYESVMRFARLMQMTENILSETK